MGSQVQVIPWQERAAAKRASTLDKIPHKWRLNTSDLARAHNQRDLTGPFIQQFLDADDIFITSKDSVDIVNAIKEGKLNAVRVTTAFCKAAAIAHQINNCLHEIFFDQALERAKYLDDYYAQNGTTIGPLHGLPISLKDQFHVKGVDTTMGYVGLIGGNLGISDASQTHQVESQIVTELLSLGAVLYCKTSVPQTLFFGETKNNIIGQTMNPHNQNLACGGSSGGEGALMALRGSTLGVGTDIGGSVRIPAVFNAVFALKPTPERVSYRDAANTIPGQTTYRSTVGFMSTSLDGLELALRSILSTQPWLRDPSVVPIPYRQEIVDQYRKRGNLDGTAKSSELPLKLGILWTDGVITPHPPIMRGLHAVANAMEQAGHKLVNWNPPPQSTARRIHAALLRADGSHDIHAQLNLSGEPLLPDLEATYSLTSPIDAIEYQRLTLEGLEYEAAYSDYWNSTAKDGGQIVDAVIMPAAPHAAVIPGKYFYIGYTETINLLNYSAVAIPVTKADKAVDRADAAYQPLNETDRLNWEAYDPELYDGAPVGVQIVGRKFKEEKTLAIAGIVCAALRRSGVE
ncbi:hypothetical protein VTK56DRAFT_6486 [Thermocarpiscus australiensis]